MLKHIRILSTIDVLRTHCFFVKEIKNIGIQEKIRLEIKEKSDRGQREDKISKYVKISSLEELC